MAGGAARPRVRRVRARHGCPGAAGCTPHAPGGPAGPGRRLRAGGQAATQDEHRVSKWWGQRPARGRAQQPGTLACPRAPSAFRSSWLCDWPLHALPRTISTKCCFCSRNTSRRSCGAVRAHGEEAGVALRPRPRAAATAWCTLCRGTRACMRALAPLCSVLQPRPHLQRLGGAGAQQRQRRLYAPLRHLPPRRLCHILLTGASSSQGIQHQAVQHSQRQRLRGRVVHHVCCGLSGLRWRHAFSGVCSFRQACCECLHLNYSAKSVVSLLPHKTRTNRSAPAAAPSSHGGHGQHVA